MKGKSGRKEEVEAGASYSLKTGSRDVLETGRMFSFVIVELFAIRYHSH